MDQYVELDIFSLSWIGKDIHQSDNTGLISISYEQSFDENTFHTCILQLFRAYPYFFSKLVFDEEAQRYQLKYRTDLQNEQILQEIEYTDEPYEALVNRLVTREYDLTIDVLFDVYVLQGKDEFTIVFHASHLLGDGVTLINLLTIFFYNYHQLYYNNITNNNTNTYVPIFPPATFHQLLHYTKKLRFNRFGRIFPPRFIRYIQGAMYFLRLQRRAIEHQQWMPEATDPRNKNPRAQVIRYTFPEELYLLSRAEIRGTRYNTNDLVTAFVLYYYFRMYGYDHTYLTYPVNLRNKLGFEVGNLLTANTIKVLDQQSFYEFLKHVKLQISKQKNKIAPYNAPLLGKFLPYDIAKIQQQLGESAKSGNIRVSNVGKIPSPFMFNQKVKTQNFQEGFEQGSMDNVPLKDFHVVALPLTSVHVHIFMSAVQREQSTYYLSIATSEQHKTSVETILENMTDHIKQLYQEIQQ